MRLLLAAAVCWAILCQLVLADEPQVPAWFQTDSKNPAAIFEVGKRLSSREASLYWGFDRNVIGGVLQDEVGEPIGNSLLAVGYHDGIRGYHATLQTDDEGRFVIFGPQGGLPLRLDEDEFGNNFHFRPAPGYPNSGLGYQFALQQNAFPHFITHVINVTKTSCFCYLTCHRQNKFDAQAFEKFQGEELAKWKNPRRKPWKEGPEAGEGVRPDKLRNEYQVKVISPEGKPIPDTLIKFYCSLGGQQRVATDAMGLATLTENLPRNQKPEYYTTIERYLTLDIPSYAVGPIPFALQTRKINVIEARPAAQIKGRLLDGNGQPMQQSVNIRYVNRAWCPFELSTYCDPAGYFTIDRIMPDEPFAIHIEGGSHLTTPSSEVFSETFTLKPGEVKEGIVLTSPQPAALRGIVVDEQDRPVTSIWKLSFFNEYGGWGHGEPKDGKFGTHGVTPMPIRIEVEATGFEPYHGDEIPLEPGELRFVKVVMKTEQPKPAKVNRTAGKK